MYDAALHWQCCKIFLDCFNSNEILRAWTITVLIRIYYPSPKNCGREEGILNYSSDWNTKEAGHPRHQHWGQVRPAPKLHKLKIFKQSLRVIKMVYHFSFHYIHISGLTFPWNILELSLQYFGPLILSVALDNRNT